MIPSRENKHEWWVGRYNQWDPWRPMTMLTTEMFEPQDERRKVFNTKSLQLFLVKKFADSNRAGLLFGGSQRVHTVEHTIFVWFPFVVWKKICMHIAYRNRNRDLIYRVSGHFGFAIARTTRSPKSQRCLWKFWWANQRVIIFTSKWSEKKVAARWGWLAPTSAESQIRSFKFTLSPIIMEAESP